MRLFALALLLALAQEPAARRTSLALTNPGKEPLAAGLQVSVRHPNAVEVLFDGAPVPTWADANALWFRLAAPLAPGARDTRYEVRVGGPAPTPRPAEVFDFFDDFREATPDPKRWEIDAGLGLESGPDGLGVTRLPATTPLRPASLVARSAPLPSDFVIEAKLQWDLADSGSLEFGVTVEVAEEASLPPDEEREIRRLIDDLDAEEIPQREAASKALVSRGRPAAALLTEALATLEGEARARAETALGLIEQASPAQRIHVGFASDGRALVRRMMIGTSRSEQARAAPLKGAATVVIRRDPDGGVSLNGQKPVKVPGRLGRLRFDFGGSKGGKPGAVWLRQVLIRRAVDYPPTAEFGR